MKCCCVLLLVFLLRLPGPAAGQTPAPMPAGMIDQKAFEQVRSLYETSSKIPAIRPMAFPPASEVSLTRTGTGDERHVELATNRMKIVFDNNRGGQIGAWYRSDNPGVNDQFVSRSGNGL